MKSSVSTLLLLGTIFERKFVLDKKSSVTTLLLLGSMISKKICLR